MFGSEMLHHNFHPECPPPHAVLSVALPAVTLEMDPGMLTAGSPAVPRD